MFPSLLVLLGCVEVKISQSLSVLQSSQSRGSPPHRLRSGSHRSDRSHELSFLSIDQVPQPKPAYVKYGEPDFTTFNNVTSACQACIEFWPEKEDALRFHSKLYVDEKWGGIWARSCRAGTCDFRDPQTEPVGGVVGKGDDRICITRDPVPWFSECEPIILQSASSLLDVTRYCSYREQLFVPPPIGTVSRFDGKPQAWARIGGTKEQCLTTIEKEGAALFDDSNFCDANVAALSGCCETVHSALQCVGETAWSIGAGKGSIFAEFGDSVTQMMESFTKYCVPLCNLCETHPGADICVLPKDCTTCTSKGGLWCPKLKSCHCPSKKPPCIAPPITAPLKCIKGVQEDADMVSSSRTKKVKTRRPPTSSQSPTSTDCPYKEMARKWRLRE